MSTTNNRTETHQENGSVERFDSLDERSARATPSAQTTIDWINDFQTANPGHTKYIDLFFNNLYDNLIKAMQEEREKPERPLLGLRVYFAQKDGQDVIVLGAIKAIGDLAENKVEVLWRNDFERFPALDYGSPCPDHCSILDNGTEDTTGYKQVNES